MRLRVVYSPRSECDLVKIRAWIAKDSGSAFVSDRFIRELLDACDSLEVLPERFPVYPRSRRWRMMPQGNYLVFFQIHGDEIRIGHIRHGARRPFGGV